MPFGMQLELSGLPENGVSTLCIVPYCIVIALCSVSVLVTVAIAVDRLTSLAQPLRYKNIITHSSIEKYIAVFWIYAIAVGLSPLIYVKIVGVQSHRWVEILSQFSLEFINYLLMTLTNQSVDFAILRQCFQPSFSFDSSSIIACDLLLSP